MKREMMFEIHRILLQLKAHPLIVCLKWLLSSYILLSSSSAVSYTHLDVYKRQDALLDRSLVTTYSQKGITQDVTTHKKEPPLMEDLYKVFLGTETAEGAELAARLEKFIKGSASGIFNQQSNFDIKNKFTVFGVRDLEENLRPIAMYIILDFVWSRIRKDKRKRVLVVDEAWYLIKHKDSAADVYKRQVFREE